MFAALGVFFDISARYAKPPNGLCQPLAFQSIKQGQQINRLMVAVHLAHFSENDLVLTIE
ncbi:Uncharacterised protein [Klebsiella pneumoniae]|nr:Uncharacterised protein [Klebsiella pneumoniae]